MEITKLFKVFSDETRIEVVKHLAKGECCTCQFEKQINVSQPTLAYHLRLIRESGLATRKKVGTWHQFHIDNDAIDYMIEYLKEIKNQLNTNCECNIEK